MYGDIQALFVITIEKIVSVAGNSYAQVDLPAAGVKKDTDVILGITAEGLLSPAEGSAIITPHPIVLQDGLIRVSFFNAVAADFVATPLDFKITIARMRSVNSGAML